MVRHLIILSNVTATAGDVNDFIELQPGATINLVGGTVNQKIWGPGTTNILGNVNMTKGFGVPATAQELTGLEKVYIDSNRNI